MKLLEASMNILFSNTYCYSLLQDLFRTKIAIDSPVSYSKYTLLKENLV